MVIRSTLLCAYNSEQSKKHPCQITEHKNNLRSTSTKKKILFDIHMVEHLKQKPTEKKSHQTADDWQFNDEMRIKWIFRLLNVPNWSSKSENNNLIIYGNHVAHINENRTEWQLINPIWIRLKLILFMSF